MKQFFHHSVLRKIPPITGLFFLQLYYIVENTQSFESSFFKEVYQLLPIIDLLIPTFSPDFLLMHSLSAFISGCFRSLRWLTLLYSLLSLIQTQTLFNFYRKEIWKTTRLIISLPNLLFNAEKIVKGKKMIAIV